MDIELCTGWVGGIVTAGDLADLRGCATAGDLRGLELGGLLRGVMQL